MIKIKKIYGNIAKIHFAKERLYGIIHFMRLPKNFGWKAYFVFYLFVVLVRLAALSSSEFPPRIYYGVLAAFDKTLSVYFILHLISCLIDALSAAPIYLYIKRIRLWPEGFWKVLFCLRIAFGLVGRKFEMIFVVSLFYMDVKVAWAYLASSLVLQLPSYLLQYRYAFEQNKFLRQ